jgi:transcriptional regulator with XRE-family HTH domain
MATKDAAFALDIAPEYLSMIENGHKQPSAKLVNRMCEIYSQPAGFFLRADQRVATT